MLTSQMIKEKARELGASVCGIGRLDLFEGAEPGRDPKQILPGAKCIIGFGFAVPKGLYLAMKNRAQYYGYLNYGVKYMDEELAEIFLLKIGAMIENAGYDACLQKSVPNLRIKGDKTTNPEVMDTYELQYASPVEPGKPAPEVIIDFGTAAKACGIGTRGLSGHILSPVYGPFIRYNFIVTDAPLETDEPCPEVCDGCKACAGACCGNAIDEKEGLDTWQCAVYYRGAHKSNPFMTEDTLRDHPDREAILNGTYRFNAKSARAVYKELDFLPKTNWGYAPCLCGKACDIACYEHLFGSIEGTSGKEEE